MSVIAITNVTNSIEEFQNFIEYTVTLDSASNVPVSVSFRTLYDGTATNLDTKNTFTSETNNGTSGSNNGTLTFEPGQTSLTLRIEADRDTIDEVDEHVVLELFDPEGATFTGGAPVLRETGIILDDDGSGNNDAVFVGDPVIIEGDGGTKVARFDIVLSRAPTDGATFSYFTFDGSALAGQDYNATSGTLTFAANQTRATLDVSVIGDTVPEGAEWFGLNLTDTSGRYAEADSVGYAEIRDTDASALPEISVRGDTTIEEFANFIRFTVSLSEPYSDAVSVSYRTLYDNSASNVDVRSILTADANNGILTFEAGQTELSILVESQRDQIDERDEALTLELFDPINATFGAGQPALRATGFILDDDEVGSNVALFVSDPVLLEIDQGTQIAQFDIELSRPAPQRITFDFATQDGSAQAGSDYIATSGTLVFEEGQSRASVQVSVLGDQLAEPSEWFSLAVTSPSTPGVVGLGGAVGYAEIRDTDATGLPEISIHGDATVEEFNNFIRFTVSLSQPYGDAVTVNYRTLFDGTATNSDLDNTMTSTSNNGTAAANNGVVTFAPGETSKSIFIESERDAIDEADEGLIVELYDPLNATFGAGQPTLRANGIILDDDGVGSNLALFVGDPVLIEANSGTQIAQFDIVLSRPAPERMVFDYSTRDGTAVAGSDFVVTTGQVVFEEGQTRASVQVSVLGDTLAEASEWFGLRLTTNSSVPVNLDDSVGYAELRDSETSPLPEISIRGDSAIEEFANFMRFTVSLSEASNDVVTVDYAMGLGTATQADLSTQLAGFGNGTLTFAPGQTELSLLVEANRDQEAERDESVVVTLSNPARGAFGTGVTSVAAGGFIFDDDTEGSARALYGAPVWVNELAGNRVGLTLELSDPSPDVLSFRIAAQGATATAGQDYRLLGDVVTFQPYETKATFYVEILPDGLSEESEFVDFGLTAVNQSLFFGEIPSVRLTIEDGPAAPEIAGNGDANTLFGTTQAELVRGGEGNDTLTGGGGDDTVNGGPGDDTAAYQGAQSAYTLTLSPGALTLVNRADPSEGTDRLVAIETLDFITEIPFFQAEGLFPLAIFDNAVDLAPEQFGRICELYIAYFNRAPDAIGLYYWADQFTLGFSLEDMAASFFVQPETRDTYANVLDADGNLTNTEAFVTQVYTNVLGRGPDQLGFDYWVNELQTNDDITVPIFILAIINGAREPSEPNDQTAIDQLYLGNKQDLGTYFAAIKGMSDVDDARDLALFDGSQTSIAATRVAFDGHYQQALNPTSGDFLAPIVGVVDDPFA